MNKSDTEKTVKLLNLTTSDNDNEALSAIRKANAILERNKIMWESVVFPEITHVNNEMCSYEKLDKLLWSGKLTTGEFSFYSSLNDFYEKVGYLTEKQKNCIKEGYFKYFG